MFLLQIVTFWRPGQIQGLPGHQSTRRGHKMFVATTTWPHSFCGHACGPQGWSQKESAKEGGVHLLDAGCLHTGPKRHPWALRSHKYDNWMNANTCARQESIVLSSEKEHLGHVWCEDNLAFQNMLCKKRLQKTELTKYRNTYTKM